MSAITARLTVGESSWLLEVEGDIGNQTCSLKNCGQVDVVGMSTQRDLSELEAVTIVHT